MAKPGLPKHVAIILDGNGRWAKKRKQPRSFGHYQGGRNLFQIAKAARDLGIKMLTVYAFSTENWKRPKEEIDYLMTKPVELFHEHKDRLAELDYKVRFIGRRDRFSADILNVIDTIENVTNDKEGFELVIAVDYGAYDELIRAIHAAGVPITEETLQHALMLKEPVDLLIRTSGEQRISNFLLWQAAYAEFYFTKVHWPAFRKRHLAKALKNYHKRHRRFGGL